MMTAGPGPRVAALLGALRPVADELLVALDDRADAAVRRDLAAVADRIVLYPFAEPVDRPLPWLFDQCRCDWALALDDDEIPSLALLEALPALCADPGVTHYWFPRQWLYPDSSTYLGEAPWRPDYQPRLVRTDSRVVRFSAEFHRPMVVSGPGRYPQLPLWHADPLLRSFEQRFAKSRHYERTRPGMRVGAYALNFAFYLPENRERLAQAIDLRFDLRTALHPLGEFERILGCLREAEDLARALGDQRRLGQMSVYRCHNLWMTGHPTEAIGFGQSAQAIAESLGDVPLQVTGNLYLGAACLRTGDYRRAEDLLGKVLQLLEGDLRRERFGLPGFPAVMARCYLTLIFADLGRFEEGIAHAQKAIRLAEALDHPYSLTFGCWVLAYLQITRESSATPSACSNGEWRCLASGI